ncbi:hypothetical protein SRHO_G00020910 [Serrasalmus rhombeus]
MALCGPELNDGIDFNFYLENIDTAPSLDRVLCPLKQSQAACSGIPPDFTHGASTLGRKTTGSPCTELKRQGLSSWPVPFSCCEHKWCVHEAGEPPRAVNQLALASLWLCWPLAHPLCRLTHTRGERATV